MSKGSKPRPCNTQKFETEFDRIFGNQQPATDFESFVASPAGQEFKKDCIIELLSDITYLKTCVIDDSFDEPPMPPFLIEEEDERQAIYDQVKRFWSEEAEKVATMIAYEDNDALLKYIHNLAESYTQDQVDLCLQKRWKGLL